MTIEYPHLLQATIDMWVDSSGNYPGIEQNAHRRLERAKLNLPAESMLKTEKWLATLTEDQREEALYGETASECGEPMNSVLEWLFDGVDNCA